MGIPNHPSDSSTLSAALGAVNRLVILACIENDSSFALLIIGCDDRADPETEIVCVGIFRLTAFLSGSDYRAFLIT
jgi:hypothetical protein